jgi:hypothetical protein
MRKYFEGTEETIERWKYAAGLLGIVLAWWIVLAVNFGII